VRRTGAAGRRTQWKAVLVNSSSWPSRLSGSRTLRPQDTSAPQKWCRSLIKITGGAVSHRNCPGSKCPGFSSITALVSKCLVGLPCFWRRSVLRSVPKCPRVSWYRSVLWPKCPVTDYLECHDKACMWKLLVVCARQRNQD